MIIITIRKIINRNAFWIKSIEFDVNVRLLESFIGSVAFLDDIIC